MAWIEVHQTLIRHPKLLRLSAKLRIHRAQSAGHLLSLWLWTLDYAPTGDLSAFGPAEISAAADYPGDAEIFSQALRDTGWIDDDGSLHDWMDYAGRLVEKRAANRDRMRDARATHVQRTNGTRAGATVPNQPNPTQPKDAPAHDEGPPPISQEAKAHGAAAIAPKVRASDPECQEIFDAYPNTREGGDSTMKALFHLESIANIRNVKPDYPLLDVVKKYAATTKKPWNFQRFLQELPDAKSFLASKPKPERSYM